VEIRPPETENCGFFPGYSPHKRKKMDIFEPMQKPGRMFYLKTGGNNL
jgi:hypothetical protein